MSPAGGSTLMTSAPYSASIRMPSGPAITAVRSTMRTPFNAPFIGEFLPCTFSCCALPPRQESGRRLAGDVAKGEAEGRTRREAERGRDLLDRDTGLAEPFDRGDHAGALLPRFQRQLGL